MRLSPRPRPPPTAPTHADGRRGSLGYSLGGEEAGCAWSALVQRHVAARLGQPPWAPGSGWVGKEQTAGCPCEGLPLFRAQKCAEGNCGCRVWKIRDLKLFFFFTWKRNQARVLKQKSRAWLACSEQRVLRGAGMEAGQGARSLHRLSRLNPGV